MTWGRCPGRPKARLPRDIFEQMKPGIRCFRRAAQNDSGPDDFCVHGLVRTAGSVAAAPPSGEHVNHVDVGRPFNGTAKTAAVVATLKR
jgi:hypothetical protein